MPHLSCWKVSYCRAGSTNIETLTVPGGSLITAYKDATEKLWKHGLAIRIIGMVVDEVQPYAVDETKLVDTAPCEMEPNDQ